MFRSPDLRAANQAEPVQIGRTKQHVVFRFGPWRIGLPIETGARFPNLDLVIPSAQDTRTRLSLSQRDRQFLRENLSEAEDADEAGEVTLDLNGAVVIRSPHKGDSPGCEWMLQTSRRTDDEISINSDEKYLRRALELGTSEIELSDSHSALVACNELTTYIWMPLRDDPIPHSDRHRRIDSTGNEVVPELAPTPPTRKQTPMLQNGTPQGRKSSSDSTPAVTETDPIDELIEQATGIKAKLKDLQTDLQELINSLKAQKKQARLVRTTLDSLQKLKTLKV